MGRGVWLFGSAFAAAAIAAYACGANTPPVSTQGRLSTKTAPAVHPEASPETRVREPVEVEAGPEADTPEAGDQEAEERAEQEREEAAKRGFAWTELPHPIRKVPAGFSLFGFRLGEEGKTVKARCEALGGHWSGSRSAVDPSFADGGCHRIPAKGWAPANYYFAFCDRKLCELSARSKEVEPSKAAVDAYVAMVQSLTRSLGVPPDLHRLWIQPSFTYYEGEPSCQQQILQGNLACQLRSEGILWSRWLQPDSTLLAELSPALIHSDKQEVSVRWYRLEVIQHRGAGTLEQGPWSCR